MSSLFNSGIPSLLRFWLLLLDCPVITRRGPISGATESCQKWQWRARHPSPCRTYFTSSRSWPFGLCWSNPPAPQKTVGGFWWRLLNQAPITTADVGISCLCINWGEGSLHPQESLIFFVYEFSFLYIHFVFRYWMLAAWLKGWQGSDWNISTGFGWIWMKIFLQDQS